MDGQVPIRTLDVLIIGGGPSGAALAIALRRCGIPNVVVIDRPVNRPFQIGESAAPSLDSLLRRVGLGGVPEANGHHRWHGNLSAWGTSAPVVEDFMYRPNGPGWHLDRAAFDSWLRAEAVSAGAQLLAPARLVAARWSGAAWRVEIETAAEAVQLESRWIVDASGRPAAFARRQGARLRHHDRLLAYAAMSDGAAAPEYSGFSIIEACETGWWYGANLPAGKCVVALMTDPDVAEDADLATPSSFWRQWAGTALISRCCKPKDRDASPVVFSANSQCLDRPSGPGWLAIGDALMALDPLSSSGLTGGMQDAIAAADTIACSLRDTEHRRTAEALSHYGARATATFERYLAERHAVYDMERRWPNSRFWQRRIRPANRSPDTLEEARPFQSTEA